MGEREEALAVGDDAAALAVGARAGRGAGLGAAAAADVTGRLDLDGHADLDARERVVERDPDARLEVGAALGRGRAGTLAATEERAEVAEQVGQVAEVDVLVARAARPEPLPRRACRAVAVVRLPLLLVGEDVVRGLHVLEPLLGRRVVRVPVRVQLAGELAVRLLDLVVGRRLLDAEHLVGIPGGHYSDTTTRAGRRTTSPMR